MGVQKRSLRSFESWPIFVKVIDILHPLSQQDATCDGGPFKYDVHFPFLGGHSASSGGSVKMATESLTFFEVKLGPYASLCLENYLDQFHMKF